MSEQQTGISLTRMADEMNVILTQIFRQYVAMGSPTKLGGLRFLDVSSSKTFAFEKTQVSGDKKGNLLVLSAPYTTKERELDKHAKDIDKEEENARHLADIEATKEMIRHTLTDGPFGESIQHLDIRASSDAGKGDKLFIEVGYYVPTLEWITDKNVLAYAQEHKLNNSRDALIGIIEEKLLPMASTIMEYLIHNLREH